MTFQQLMYFIAGMIFMAVVVIVFDEALTQDQCDAQHATIVEHYRESGIKLSECEDRLICNRDGACSHREDCSTPCVECVCERRTTLIPYPNQGAYDPADYRTSEPGCPVESPGRSKLWYPPPGRWEVFDEPCGCWRARMEMNDGKLGAIQQTICGQPEE